MALATGQITIIDLNDAVTLQGYIGGSLANGQLVDNNGANPVPNWASTNLVLTASLSKMGAGANIIDSDAAVGNITWSYQLGSGAETAITSGADSFTVSGTKNKVLTIAANKMTLAQPSIKFIATLVYTHPTLGALTYKMDIAYVLQKTGLQGVAGNDAYTVVMSNEAHSFPSDENGNFASALATTTQVTAYKGTTPQNVTVGTLPTVAGMTLSVASNGTTAPVITITANTGTGLAAIGQAVIPLTVDGKSFSKTFSYAKIKSGTAATEYALQSSVGVLTLTKTGVFAPTTVTFNATSAYGTAAPVAYAGRFKIYESTDGINFGAATYTSAGNESSKAYTPSGATVKAIKCEVYLAGGTTTLLDTQGVSIVTDGVDTITSFGSMPEGNVFYNTLGTNPSLKAEILVYNGNTQIATGTPTYKWYYQDGASWTQISNAANTYAGATTYQLTIYANAVDGTETYKGVATYGGKDYAQYFTIIDQTDPYQVTVLSTGGDVFKNSQGTSVLTAKVQQSGAELDPLGSGLLTYTWSKFDKDGAPVAGFTPSPAEMGKTSGTSTTTIIAVDANAWNAFGVGSKIIVGAEAVKTVSAKSASTPYTLTIPALTVAPATGVAIKDGSNKRVYITHDDITEKATFYCDIS
jgi:hypothetical protein